MKKFILAAFLLANSFGFANAKVYCETETNATFMAGIAFNFGGNAGAENIGFTLKALNTNEADHFVIGAGGTFYPWSEERFGLDLSGGYNFNESTALVGYDFLKKAPVVSGGWVNTADESTDCFK